MIKINFQTIVDYLQAFHDKTLAKNPEEKSNMKGIVKFEIYPQMTYLLIYYYLQQKGNLLYAYKRPEKDRMQFKKACYYNSLSYMKKYKEKFPELKLAWGISVDEVQMKRTLKDIHEFINGNLKWSSALSGQIGIRHAFNIYKGKVIDPTIPSNRDIIAYELVGENIYNKFNWLDNDKNWNAESFAGYCDSRENAIIRFMTKKILQKLKLNY